MASPAISHDQRRSPSAEFLTLLAFCGFFLFIALGSFGLVGADEPRYAQIAREMLARHDWVVPVLNGRPWLEKPVLYYWEAMISYRVFGVSDWAARIPSAFSASLMIVAIYVFWRRVAPKAGNPAQSDVLGRVSALDVALITLSTAAVIGFGRAASTDMLLAANFTVAMLCWVARYAEPEEAGASPAGERWFHPRLLLFYVFLALATLAKGPVAPGLAGIVIVALALVRRDWSIVRRTFSVPGILVYLAVAAPWFWLVQQRTGNFFRVFFFEHNLERFGTNTFRHPQPFWYYIPVTLAAVLPWSVWACVGLWRGAREMRRSSVSRDLLTQFLVLWAIVPVAFFSFSQSKLPGYILPAVPAWTLLAALGLERMAQGPRSRRVALVFHSAVCAALVGGAIVSPYLLLKIPISATARTVAIGVALAIFAGLLLTLYRNLSMLRFATLVPVLIAVAYVLRIATPSIEVMQSARPVARKVDGITLSYPGAAAVAVLHVKRETEYGLNFYLNREIQSYDRAEIPAADHLVVAREGSEHELADLAGGRRVVRLTAYSPQHLEFFWVTRVTTHTPEDAH